MWWIKGLNIRPETIRRYIWYRYIWYRFLKKTLVSSGNKTKNWQMEWEKVSAQQRKQLSTETATELGENFTSYTRLKSNVCKSLGWQDSSVGEKELPSKPCTGSWIMGAHMVEWETQPPPVVFWSPYMCLGMCVVYTVAHNTHTHTQNSKINTCKINTNNKKNPTSSVMG